MKDLEIDNTGNLIFDGSIMQKQLNYDLPLQINATSGNLETLFRPSNCSFSSSFIKSFSDTLGVLSVSLQPNLQLDSIVFYNSTNVSYKSLVIDNNDKLVYDSDEVQLVKNAFGQINVATPLTISSTTLANGSTGITLDTLWKPSSINIPTDAGLLNIHNDTTGQTTLTLTDSYRFQDLKIRNGSTVKSFTQDGNGDILWDSNIIKDYNYLKTNYLNAVDRMADATSPISLGSAQTTNTHKIAVYENTSSSYTLGSFFYGSALWLGSGVQGIALYATGVSLPRLSHLQSTSSGYEDPILLCCQTSRFVGINTVLPQYTLHVSGDGFVSGNLGCNVLNATTKNFDIPHPNPDKSKANYRLRHWCLEGDDVGGAVVYRRKINCNVGANFIIMPDWFEYLTSDVLIFTSPFKHFGQSYGEQDETDKNKIIITCSAEGDYNVLITACRNDDGVLSESCPKEVEYVKDPCIDCECVPNPT